jgi:flavin-dependent dehydrogenase
MVVGTDFDVVIVGAGVAGGALATRTARDGFSVLMLERTLVHLDRIRGEKILPRRPESNAARQTLIADG